MTNLTMLCANRPRLLKQALDSIGDLSQATLTIRDAGINDEVRDLAEQWTENVGGKHSCHLFASKLVPLGTGSARNQVIQSSEYCFGRGDYLYLSDDDVFFLRPDWLSTLIRSYEVAWQAGFKVIGAYNHPYHQPTAAIPADGKAVYEVLALALQSMLMRWEVWDKYGPFCETPPGKVCQGEDGAFGNAIRADGGRLGVIAPPLLVNCGITNSFGEPIPGVDLVRQQAPQGVIVE